ncbi:MAG: LemA family protein [Bacteroides sp.]|nr:LemA family protein [Bacteroides sp.]MCM1550319.1 LemA family protein [Clostridium sp.]
MGNSIVVGVIVGIVVILLILVVWYVSTMNKLRASALKVDEADSGIDVALTKRYDVLTKQLAVVKEYTSHESKTLFETIRLRSGMSVDEKIQAANTMTEVGKLFRLTAEAYPELKSSANYIALQNSITDVEEHLQAARRLYNANATDYNTRIVMFPASIVANMLGMKSRTLFQAEEYKRSDVEMKF